MGRPTLALTLGDPAGIGPEIMAKALAEGSAYDHLVPAVVGDHGVLAQVIEGCGLDLELRRIEHPGEARGERGVVDLIDLDNVGDVRFGEIDADQGRACLEWIERACALARDGAVEGLVTGPINKEAAKAGGLKFPGHTELLADLLGADPDDVYTMFVVGKLRIFFLTRHLSLRDAIDTLETDRVHTAIVRVSGLLRRARRRAAEGRARGSEPARVRARDDGRRGGACSSRRSSGRRRTASTSSARCPPTRCSTRATRGASTASSRSTTTRATSRPRRSILRHGRATLGLPVIRTSVDHGTAYDLAGAGRPTRAGRSTPCGSAPSSRPARCARLNADRVALHPARVRARAQRPVRRARDRAEAAERPRLDHVDVVAAAAQLLDDLGRDARLDVHPPQLGLAREERARQVIGVERRRVDRLLEVAPEHGVLEEQLQRPLVLLVAARGAERQARAVLVQRERRRERRARPAAGRERAREAVDEPEHLRARAEAEAEARDRGRALQPAAARRGGDEVAVAVGDVEVARVAERRLADPREPLRAARPRGCGICPRARGAARRRPRSRRASGGRARTRALSSASSGTGALSP